MRDTSKESGLRTAHTMLLPHIDAEGTRPSVLAGRLGVTKQAVGQLVDELVEMGFLERVHDPADARARLVRFSKRGRKSVSTGLDVLEAMEAELSEKIGEKRMIELRRALAALDALLAPSAE
ncbi:MAG: MarR family transcriptional regulator [Myxococcales bacterium]|nr:MarR family transcriptional regulator [Myxococcales bacterium]